jgi:hypothetical protein
MAAAAAAGVAVPRQLVSKLQKPQNLITNTTIQPFWAVGLTQRSDECLCCAATALGASHNKSCERGEEDHARACARRDGSVEEE